LRRFNMPATVYLTTGAIGRHRPTVSDDFPGLYTGQHMLTWAVIQEMSRDGMSIGAHYVQHADLTRTAPEEVCTGLAASRHSIEAEIGAACTHFSYPWGRFNPRVAEWVREAGYETAVSGIHAPLSDRTDSFSIPRMDVRAEYTLDDFKALLAGDWDYLGLVQRLRRLVHR